VRICSVRWPGVRSASGPGVGGQVGADMWPRSALEAALDAGPEIGSAWQARGR
jgi:hypothetical protein